MPVVANYFCRNTGKALPTHKYTSRLSKILQVAIADPDEEGRWGASRDRYKCAAVRIRDDSRPSKGLQNDRGRLNAILLHELAHVVADDGDADAHGPKFKEAEKFLINMFTNNLKGKVVKAPEKAAPKQAAGRKASYLE